MRMRIDRVTRDLANNIVVHFTTSGDTETIPTSASEHCMVFTSMTHMLNFVREALYPCTLDAALARAIVEWRKLDNNFDDLALATGVISDPVTNWISFNIGFTSQSAQA